MRARLARRCHACRALRRAGGDTEEPPISAANTMFKRLFSLLAAELQWGLERTKLLPSILSAADRPR